MACPFLKEGRARYCHAAPVRKMLLDGPGLASVSRCESGAHRDCEWFANGAEQQYRCPHLEDIRVQYCSASSVAKLVPVGESQISNCTTNYRYCDPYLTLAHPHAHTPSAQLQYAPNHFWIDVDASGLCHIGMDEFFAEVVDRVEGVTFITLHGTHRPSLALTVHGVDWPMTFPNPLLLQTVNSRARSDPARITSDPHGKGWLFEGWELPGRTRAGLVSGAQAAAWQKEEREHLAREIHETDAPNCDGGTPVRGVTRFLSREQTVCLFQHFFSKQAWTLEE